MTFADVLKAILRTSETIKNGMGAGKVDVFIAQGEFHEQASIDIGLGVNLGDKKETDMSKQFRGWVKSKL